MPDRGLLRAAALTAAFTAFTLTGTAAPAAPFEDSTAQRVLACTGCHGPQGRSTSGGYLPRIAGKPAGYLYNQLLNFRDGRRAYGPMASLLEPLAGPAGNAFLLEIAGHFAALDLPYPPPQPALADAATRARGEALVRRGDPARQIPACTACHGVDMLGVAPAIPGLLGLPRDYLNAQLGAWKNGRRQAQVPDCMAGVARALSADDLSAVTAWLAAQTVPAGAKPAPSLGAALPVACGGVPAAVGAPGGGAK